eukprot:Em0005g350a
MSLKHQSYLLSKAVVISQYTGVPLPWESTSNVTYSVKIINGKDTYIKNVPSFIQMASISSVGLIGPYSEPVESNSPSNCYLYVTISALQNMATFKHYCLFNCSSEQFAPYSHSNITKSGLVVFGVLNGLTSGHRYYCRAAAVNDAMAVPNENESMTMHINFSTLSTIKIRPQNHMKVAIMFQDLTTAIINCTFLARQSHYCLICCSDEVNMTTFPIGNILASKGLKVTAQLSGLENNEIYYCTATGTNDGANMCNTGNTEFLYRSCAGPAYWNHFVPINPYMDVKVRRDSTSKSDARVYAMRATGCYERRKAVILTHGLTMSAGGNNQWGE